jgi:hypothetical protein
MQLRKEDRNKPRVAAFLVAPGVVEPFENGMNVDEALAITGAGRSMLVDFNCRQFRFGLLASALTQEGGRVAF